MTNLAGFARHNAIALAALFIALGGTGWAAASLPAASVGTRQLRNHSVTAAKLNREIAGYVRDWAKISGIGTVIASRPRAHTVNWSTTGLGPGGIVSWGRQMPSSCLALASTQYGSTLTPSVSAVVYPTGTRPAAGVAVQLSASAPVNVAVICPHQ